MRTTTLKLTLLLGSAACRDTLQGVRFLSRASLAWSGQQIELQAAVDGPSEAVELLHGGAPLAGRGAARQFTWDTRAEPEVVHLLVARARLGERVVTSAPLEVTVDHTPSALVARGPKGVAEEAWMAWSTSGSRKNPQAFAVRQTTDTGQDHRNPAPEKVDQAREQYSGQAWTTL